MRKYEVMVILTRILKSGQFSQAWDVPQRRPWRGGTVDNVDIWGRRRLAYEINKKSDGIYVVIDLNCKIETVKEPIAN